MKHRPAGGSAYQDPLVAIRDGALAIRRYYFPTGTKRIALSWLVVAAVLVRYGPRDLARRDRVQPPEGGDGHVHAPPAGRMQDEARLLSELALRSKGYWGYDQAFLDACRAELTLALEEVETRRVTVAERDGQVVGFYALVGEPPEGTLADLFVAPERIRSGVGRALWGTPW